MCVGGCLFSFVLLFVFNCFVDGFLFGVQLFLLFVQKINKFCFVFVFPNAFQHSFFSNLNLFLLFNFIS